ncbi:MAG: branched-chain amino acid transaminase, partial [Flavobacteriales bacterium]
MADRDGLIWMDGQMVDWREAKVHVLTHTLHYGMGVFEGVRAYETELGTAIFRLKEHTQRLMNSAKIFQMNVPFDAQTLMDAQCAVVRENNLVSGYLRPIIWIGSERMGIAAKNNKIHVAIAAWPWGAYLGEDGINKGIRVKTSSFTHHQPNITMCKAKAVGNYPVSILAHQEVATNGYDEAMLLDPHGFICQGAGENLFMVRDGALHTPIADCFLNGLTRQTVIALAKEQGLEVIERRIMPEELKTFN